MKTMVLKYFLFVSLVLTLPKTCWAQPPGGPGGDGPPSGFSEMQIETPEEIAKRETKWMKRKLKLSKEQLATIEDINFDNALKKQEFVDNLMKKGSRPTREQMTQSRKTLDLLAEEKDSKLSKVLTEKQWSTYLSKKKQLNDSRNTPSGAPEGRVGRDFPPQ
jgi:hypothetical protein